MSCKGSSSPTCGGVHLEQPQVGVGHKQSPIGSDSDPQRPPTAGLLLSGACRKQSKLTCTSFLSAQNLQTFMLLKIEMINEKEDLLWSRVVQRSSRRLTRPPGLSWFCWLEPHESQRDVSSGSLRFEDLPQVPEFSLK